MMYNDYEALGFVPLAINLNENINTVKYYARQYTYPFLRDAGSVWNVYRMNGYIPLNYVIDPNGIVRYAAEGFNEAAIRQTIETWLPVEHDVGVVRIMSPISPLDSGTVVTPSCSVFNYGANTESYQVRMKIGTTYEQAVSVNAHPSGTAVVVTFPQWTALQRGANPFSCSTELAGDLRPEDDKLTGSTNVAVYDIAVTAIVAPPESVDSGVSITPRVVVTNPGTMYLRPKLIFSIGSFYRDSISKSLLPDQVDTVSLPSAWIASPVGTHAMKCTAVVVRDLNPTNNVLYSTVRVVSPTGLAEQPPGRLRELSCGGSNPMTGALVIRYTIERGVTVDLSLYSASGALVRRLFSGPLAAGTNEWRWDGRDDNGKEVEAGIYYCRLRSSDGNAVLKIIKP